MLTAKIYAQAKQTPEKIAIVFNDRSFTYRHFACLIEASRRYLADQGVAGEGVAVLPTDSMLNPWILGLALRSLGLTTLVVLTPDHIGALGLPDIRYVVAVAGDHRPDLDRLCAASGWRFISVPPDIYADAAQASVPDLPELQGSYGGHIRLTSGTTGLYKKFLIDAETEAARLRNRQEIFGLSAESVFNVVDFGGWTGVGYEGATAAWDASGTVVIYQGPHKWESFLRARVTHALVTPRMLSEILHAPADALCRDDALRLCVGGGPLSEAMAKAARARLTSQLYTSISCTEAGPYALTPIRRADDLRWHRIAASREVQIVDEEDRVLPAGRVGQIRIRPLGNVTGYLHNAAASRTYFRHGYFYPGDLGMLRSDGRLAFHGRVTDVINVGGNKIAAAPIEALLQNKLEVSGVCTWSLPNGTAGEEVHVAIETDRPIDQARLEDALHSTLKDAPMTRVHFVATFPRNHMGKVQRDELRKMVASSKGENRHQRRQAKKLHIPARIGTPIRN